MQAGDVARVGEGFVDQGVAQLREAAMQAGVGALDQAGAGDLGVVAALALEMGPDLEAGVAVDL